MPRKKYGLCQNCFEMPWVNDFQTVFIFLCQNYESDFWVMILSKHYRILFKNYRRRKVFTLELDFFNENNVQHQEYYEHLKSQF